jgi:hypothetical protein
MKILLLVLSSDTEPVYARHREVWRSYMHRHPNITSYFLECGDVTRVEGDVFYSPGPESFRACVTKTLAALEYFSGESYDYVLRTNMSSLWNLNKLVAFIEDLPRTQVYAGTLNYAHNVHYISGSGILMSWDVCRYILENRDAVLNVRIIDDVDIGVVLAHIQQIPIPRWHVDSPTTPISDDVFHYRVKMENGHSRFYEPEIMKQILAHWGIAVPEWQSVFIPFWLRGR